MKKLGHKLPLTTTEIRLPGAGPEAGSPDFANTAGSKIPLNPPLAKGDFPKNSAKFPPLIKGGRGDFYQSSNQPEDNPLVDIIPDFAKYANVSPLY
jgi:hypothetical protein